jgi:glycogen debranching enzyme
MRGYCYDVIDGPEGNDPSLRPNQLFAVSLPHSPLSFERQRAIVDVCERELLTPRGLRSLGPDEPAYIGRYGGDLGTRDAAYHQGTAWGWLIGPFALAHLRVYQDPQRASAYLEPLFQNLWEHGVGSLSEIFDGNHSFSPRGCIAQAWTVAQFLWAKCQIERF